MFYDLAASQGMLMLPVFLLYVHGTQRSVSCDSHQDEAAPWNERAGERKSRHHRHRIQSFEYNACRPIKSGGENEGGCIKKRGMSSDRGKSGTGHWMRGRDKREHMTIVVMPRLTLFQKTVSKFPIRLQQRKKKNNFDCVSFQEFLWPPTPILIPPRLCIV